MRKVTLTLAAITITLALGLAGCTCKSNPEAEKKALQSAKYWLALIDTEQYGQSWDESAQYFKDAIAKEQWEGKIRGVRKPLGKTISRELKSKRYKTYLPGAPDGEYVVIQFKSSFENKEAAIETITPMLDKDGQWRVSGYYIK